MTAMIPATHTPRRSEFVIVRLLRCWIDARIAGEPALPRVVACAAELRISPEAGISLASVFQLAEAALGRSMVTSGTQRLLLSCDERAILALLADGPDAGPVATVRLAPHGLPGVLVWAVRTARIMLNNAGLTMAIADLAVPLNVCPFNCPEWAEIRCELPRLGGITANKF